MEKEKQNRNMSVTNDVCYKRKVSHACSLEG